MFFLKRPRVSNWCLYVAIMVILSMAAWVYGERLLYIALIVLAAMPVVSLVLTFILLRGLRVAQDIPHTVVKEDETLIKLRLHNAMPAPLGQVQCTFITDNFAVECENSRVISLQSLQTVLEDVPFTILYRGIFTTGLQYLYAVDFMGLFRLRRKINKKTTITVLPRMVDMMGFPLAMHLLTQAHSRFDIKDEDYTTISDIRPYIPTDSIKRVHWKLTAKRNEWLVKNFQSNALNQVTLIFDAKRLSVKYQEQIVLEDRMIETAIGLARFCLRKGMPVDFLTGDGNAAHCQNPATFDVIYRLGSRLVFNEVSPLNPQSMLSQVLNDASGYLNTIICTARPHRDLYERIINGMNNGHYIALLYFPTTEKDEESETIFDLLVENGVPCYRLDAQSFIEEEGVA